MSKVKNAAKVVGNGGVSAVKGVGGGIFAAFNSVWKYGGKFLLIAYAVIGFMVFGLYNPILPDYTIAGFLSAGVSQFGLVEFMTQPLAAGVGLAGVVFVLALMYVVSNVKKLGTLGIVGLVAVMGGLGFWLFTLGAFQGMAMDVLAFVVQAFVVFVLAFGQVFSKIDRIISGSGNVDIISDATDE